MEKTIEEQVYEHLLHELTLKKQPVTTNNGDARTKRVLDAIAKELGTNDRDSLQRVVTVLIKTGVLKN